MNTTEPAKDWTNAQAVRRFTSRGRPLGVYSEHRCECCANRALVTGQNRTPLAS